MLRFLLQPRVFHTLRISHRRQLTTKDALRQNLDSYFETATFNFAKDTHKPQLQKWMELVYLREKPLVAIDVEAWERDLKKVTEIGVAIYDPGDQLHLIQPRIRTLHIILREHRKLTNNRYVPDNKEFFNGGSSYVMGADELSAFLNPILSHYLKDKGGVLVGHHVGGDIAWLTKLGIKMDNVETVDTEKIHNISRRGGGSLRGTLRLVEIPHARLHNAANDAYYTLLAAFSYCDPAQRRAFDLDTFLVMPKPNPEEKKKYPYLAVSEKFSDRAKLVPATEAPSFGDFIA